MITVLTEDDGRAALRRQDVGSEVGAVDGVPEVLGLANGLISGQLGVAGEVRTRIPECRVAQREESTHIPVAYVVGVGIDVDREVEEVTDSESRCGIRSRP